MKTLLLKPVDAAWLMLDSPDTPMHVGALAIFGKPRNAAPDYLSQLVATMRAHTEVCAPWNYRLAAFGAAGTGW